MRLEATQFHLMAQSLCNHFDRSPHTYYIFTGSFSHLYQEVDDESPSIHMGPNQGTLDPE